MYFKRIAGMILCVSLAAFASAQVVGMIEYLEGTVEVTRNGEAVKRADIGTPIENLDIIKTGPNGMVSIALDKSTGLTGSVQIVSSSTAIMRREQLSSAQSNEVELLAGSVNLKVKKMAGSKSTAQVRTQNAVLGVRGTEFSVASFNGSALVGCKEGEVFCSPSSSDSPRTSPLDRGVSAVPGTLVEVLETGTANTGAFPVGDYDSNWKEMRNKWKTYNVELFTANPVAFLNKFIINWKTHSDKTQTGLAALRNNAALRKWLEAARSGKSIGNMGEWAKERPEVMKELIALKPSLTIAVISMYRIDELIPYIPESEMGKILVNGQTVREFITQFNRVSKVVFEAAAVFHAAEKLYMLRNDGVSPFADF